MKQLSKYNMLGIIFLEETLHEEMQSGSHFGRLAVSYNLNIVIAYNPPTTLLGILHN